MTQAEDGNLQKSGRMSDPPWRLTRGQMPLEDLAPGFRRGAAPRPRRGRSRAACRHCVLAEAWSVHSHLHATFRALSPRGGPIRAGWNRTAAASVQTSARAISLPMLDMPGWSESQRLPNAVAVVPALQNTARLRRDCSRLVRPARQAVI